MLLRLVPFSPLTPVKAFGKRVTTYPLRQGIRHLLTDMHICCLHLRALRKSRQWANQTGLQLNVGCGPNRKEGWVNIDIGVADADLRLDLRCPLPFPDNSASIVYAEHFFEHIEYPLEACQFLTEAFRILAPGGRLSIGIPDFERFITAYVTKDPQFYRELYAHKQPEWIRETRMHTLNWIFRANGHQYAYDFETLEKVFSEAGFTNITRRPFDPSFDCVARQFATMYVDAVKP